MVLLVKLVNKKCVNKKLCSNKYSSLCNSKIKHFRRQTKFSFHFFDNYTKLFTPRFGESPKIGGEMTGKEENTRSKMWGV